MSIAFNPDLLTPDQKRELLAALLQKKAQAGAENQPVSFGQEALLYFYKRAPESFAYNTKFVLRLHSAVDAGALRAAFDEVVRRHAILRTVYVLSDQNVSQKTLPAGKADFETIDGSSWTERELDAALEQHTRRPFDLEQGPVLRIRLFLRAPERSILLIAAHHIAIDYWSFVVLMDEIQSLYPAIRAGRLSPLAELHTGFPEYARWQRQMVESETGQRMWEF